MPGFRTPRNGREGQPNPLNHDFKKREFQELWSRINGKAAYTVHFETPELVGKCIAAIKFKELKPARSNTPFNEESRPSTATYDEVQAGEAFRFRGRPGR